MKSYLSRMAPGVGRVTGRIFAARRAAYLVHEGRRRAHERSRLRAIFTAQWGYYGSTPSRSSFAIRRSS
jgi:all-trans-retinol 13,14-reductase